MSGKAKIAQRKREATQKSNRERVMVLTPPNGKVKFIWREVAK